MPSLMAFKIVVTTCQDADILVQARLTNRDLMSLQNRLLEALHPGTARRLTPIHWTALLVDEAAQATEPESLIPLSVATPPPNDLNQPPIFVMAGDQHQLNPRTYNRSTNLHISLFERLSSTPVYASHPKARKHLHHITESPSMIQPPFTNLIRNYRSHPAILSVPSSLFYANTLIPEASQTETLLPWAGWQGRRWPVLFACNAGIDDCEDVRGAGRGWYNMQEARKAITYAQTLLVQGLILIPSEICIMSPFQVQVSLLRNLARQARLYDLNIGPMEAFQGLESRFVILCTTRARKRFLKEDEVMGMGIVNEKKKFNVAITRAKEGLVVIGNPWVLATDPHWVTLMEFCWRNGLWQGDTNNAPRTAFDESHVNIWKPDGKGGDMGSLENALVYREQHAEPETQAGRRVMGGGESMEDTLWRIGLEAQEAVDDDYSNADDGVEDEDI